MDELKPRRSAISRALVILREGGIFPELCRMYSATCEVFIALPGVDEREIVTDKREENPTQGIVDDLRRES